MLKRRLIESEGDEIFEEITSSTVWRVPNRCRSVDVFIVGGGSNGSNGGAWKSGSGGRGGECKSYYNIPVSPGQEISIVVGSPSQQSYFLDSTTYNARGGYGSLGGSGMSGLDWPSYENGNPGSPGVYAFDNKYTSKYPNRYGAGGGGGGAYTDYSGSTYYGGSGGSYGGGKVGNSGTQNKGDDGSDATFYGAGGGGGGNGYQGIVILHYYKS